MPTTPKNTRYPTDKHENAQSSVDDLGRLLEAISQFRENGESYGKIGKRYKVHRTVIWRLHNEPGYRPHNIEMRKRLGLRGCLHCGQGTKPRKKRKPRPNDTMRVGPTTEAQRKRIMGKLDPRQRLKACEEFIERHNL